jgi:hypothetical protein
MKTPTEIQSPKLSKAARPATDVSQSAVRRRKARIHVGLGLMLLSLIVGSINAAIMCVAPEAMFLPGVMIGFVAWALAIAGMYNCRQAPQQAGRRAIERCLVFTLLGELGLLAAFGLRMLASLETSSASALGTLRMATYVHAIAILASLIGFVLLIVFLKQLAAGMHKTALVKTANSIFWLSGGVLVLPLAVMFAMPEFLKFIGTMVTLGSLSLFVLVQQVRLMVGLRSALVVGTRPRREAAARDKAPAHPQAV